MIISLVTMKGGSGKSTAAMCLAGQWHAGGRAVALVDADPAATVLRWCETGSDFANIPTVAAFADGIAATAAEFAAAGKDRIIVDTPGFRSPVLEAAIACSDLILIPIRPSPIDFQVAADTAELVDEIIGSKSGATVRLLLNQSNPSSVIARHMRAEMENAGYNLLDGQLSTRVVYGEAALAGTTPTFAQPRGAAAREIAELGAEIDVLMGEARETRSKAGRPRG
jgi:chromosome partitioning protein